MLEQGFSWHTFEKSNNILSVMFDSAQCFYSHCFFNRENAQCVAEFSGRQFQSLLYNYVWISNGENKTFIKNRWRFQFNSILHAANHNYKWNGFKESNVLMVFWYFSWSPPLSLYRPFPSVFSSCNASPSPSFDRSSLKDQKCLHRYKIVEHRKSPHHVLKKNMWICLWRIFYSSINSIKFSVSH